MKVIVGGCGSSGTTLTAKILNSHPDIYCGEEASIFDRPGIFDLPSEQFKALLSLDHYQVLDSMMPYPIVRPSTGGAQSYFGLSEARWDELWQGIPRESIIQWLDEETPIDKVFSNMLIAKANESGKAAWAEKTPGNIFNMYNISEMWPDALFIVAVRNPQDTIASLIFKRHFNMFSAIVRWVASANALINLINVGVNLHVIEYDYLCDPVSRDAVLMDMWEFLEVDMGAPTIHGSELVEDPKPTWMAYEDRISDGMRHLVRIMTHDLWQEVQNAILVHDKRRAENA